MIYDCGSNFGSRRSLFTIQSSLKVSFGFFYFLKNSPVLVKSKVLSKHS